MLDGGSRAGINAAIDGGLGVAYEWVFSPTMSLKIKAGYEITHWFNTKAFVGHGIYQQITPYSATQPFTVDGFTLRASLRF